MRWPVLVPRIALRTQLLSLLPGYERLHPTAGDPGATRTGDQLPTGFDHLEVSTDLPAGSFETAAEAIRTLAMHRASGLLTTATKAVAVGETVVLGVPVGPLALVVPCRVTWTSNVGEEQGFGYATLPGHPETGEEAFLVTRDAAGHVRFTVRAFSRPAGLARLVSPLGKAAARATIGKYLAAMRELTA